VRDTLPKNILITSSNFPRGSAAANYLNLFCRGITERGTSIEVFILKGFFLGYQHTADTKKNVTDYGVCYSYLGFVNRSSNKLIKILGDLYSFFSLGFLLLSLFRDRKNITVFAYNNEIHHSILLNLYCRLVRIKIVTFVPEYYDPSEFTGGILKRLRWYSFLINFNYVNRWSDKLIAFSSFIKNKYIEKKYPEHNIMIQPNLTDFDFWYSESASTDFTIGYSGTPYKKDGIEDLLTAVGLLNKNNIGISLLIVGDVVNENSIIPSLRDLCDKLGIRKSVTFTGYVPIEDVKKWLNKCEILAITRPNIVQTVAGFPTKIGEYFACSKTVLSTKIGDVGNYFRDREEIIFAESGNPKSIAENIEWILSNRDKCREIAKNGNRKARELLDYQTRVPSMIDFINHI
jgi:glycosyltransferase involved in cell wall biosynthesis